MKYLDLNEIRIGILGNVDSGKSTTIGVLKNKILDNGNGSARSKVLHYPHELYTGRTSSIKYIYIRNNHKNLHNVTLIDLAGHEKYLKTTFFGMNGCVLDYVIVCIGSNMGVIGTTIEHIRIATSLHIPIIFVLTKIDICPLHIRKNTIKVLKNVLKSFDLKFLFKIKNESDLIKTSKLFDNNYKTICPLIPISNKTGKNINLVRKFINQLKSKKNWSKKKENHVKFLIDSSFSVHGLSLIVSGLCMSGSIYCKKTYWFGPFNGSFFQFKVKSIHNNFRENVNKLMAGRGGCCQIKSINSKITITQNQIIKGVCLTNEPISVRCFDAEIVILHHQSTIQNNYEAVLHCNSIQQTVIITEIKDNSILRSNDRAFVRLTFKYRPEMIDLNDNFILRNGKMKIIGKIIQTILTTRTD